MSQRANNSRTLSDNHPKDLTAMQQFLESLLYIDKQTAIRFHTKITTLFSKFHLLTHLIKSLFMTFTHRFRVDQWLKLVQSIEWFFVVETMETLFRRNTTGFVIHKRRWGRELPW